MGQFIYDIPELGKRIEEYRDVWVEDDVRIGCNVTILKGITIGIVAFVVAGTVVTKSVCPYPVVGSPAKKIKTDLLISKK